MIPLCVICRSENNISHDDDDDQHRKHLLGQAIPEARSRPEATTSVQCETIGEAGVGVQARQIPEREQAHGTVQGTEFDRDPDQDLVPKSKDQVEETTDIPTEDRPTTRNVRECVSVDHVPGQWAIDNAGTCVISGSRHALSNAAASTWRSSSFGLSAQQ